MAGLYIHIPFCVSRCIYCGFYSTTSIQLQNSYIDALCKELDIRRRETEDGVSTIYLGGGTPSCLSHQNLEKLFEHIYNVYNVAEDAEVTMECNPDDVTGLLFEELPVNRISMGVQTFSDERLKFLHRRHSASQAIKAVEILHKADIHNINIDLMFGFPSENIEDWQTDILQAIKLMPEHISAYSLMYENGTRLKKMKDDGKIEEIDEELSLRMYDMLIDLLTANGYEHYEISNFARKKNDSFSFRSRHNSGYWHDIPYIGIGAAAHSYDKITRSWNVADVKDYILSIDRGILPREIETLDDDTHYDDMVTTAMRTKEGLKLSDLKEKYQTYIKKEAQKYIDGGLLGIKDGYISLTRKGLYVSDMIMADLMYGE